MGAKTSMDDSAQRRARGNKDGILGRQSLRATDARVCIQAAATSRGEARGGQWDEGGSSMGVGRRRGFRVDALGPCVSFRDAESQCFVKTIDVLEVLVKSGVFSPLIQATRGYGRRLVTRPAGNLHPPLAAGGLEHVERCDDRVDLQPLIVVTHAGHRIDGDGNLQPERPVAHFDFAGSDPRHLDAAHLGDRLLILETETRFICRDMNRQVSDSPRVLIVCSR